MSHDHLVVRGAREHNLKDISIEIPRDALVVFTGLSGSGKSSLAFDTIFAEGQRRYVESLSAYARQFLGQMDKPDVDFIEGLSPAVSIDQKSTNRNPRSTVGTITEVYDYLRLLFARAGRPHCPVCGEPVGRQTPQQIVDRLLELPEKTRFQVLAPVVRARKGEYVDLFAELQSKGFSRARVDGEVVSLTDPPKLEKQVKHTIDVVVDRLVAKGAESSAKRRLTDSVETALGLAGGVLVVEFVDLEEGDPERERRFSEKMACPNDHPLSMDEVEPRSFSFNSPFGACPECTGIGTELEVDPELIVPDDDLTLAEGAIAPVGHRARAPPTTSSGSWPPSPTTSSSRWTSPGARCRQRARDALLHGKNHKVHVRYKNRFGRERSYSTGFEGAVPFVKRRHGETDSDWSRERYEGYMREVPCPVCKGARLKPESLAVLIGGQSIADVSRLAIGEAAHFLDTVDFTERERQIAERVIKEINARLGFLLDVGLDYLSLVPTGRHAVRWRGAADPARDPDRLRPRRGPLRPRRAEHRAAPARQPPPHRDAHPAARPRQHAHRRRARRGHHRHRRLGRRHRPGRGRARRPGRPLRHGRRGCSSHPDSLTGHVPVRPARDRRPRVRRPQEKGRRGHRRRAPRSTTSTTSRSRFPLGNLVAVTGVSGSGKSTLVNDILYNVLANKLNGARHVPGRHKTVTGLEHLDKVVHVDQSPIGRTPRSNAATYTGVFDHVRKLFATTTEAKVRGYQPGRFSFNVKGGRCEACSGDGTIKIEMNFLPDVYVPCEVCHGARYNRETLEVHFKGKTVADVLDMPIEEAADFFAAVPAISRHMQHAQRGRPGLRPARPARPHPVRWRGAARQARLRAAEAQHRADHLRPRRADHRPALRGHPQAAQGAPGPGRQGQHRHRHRAQPRRHQECRLGRRPRSRGRQRWWPRSSPRARPSRSPRWSTRTPGASSRRSSPARPAPSTASRPSARRKAPASHDGQGALPATTAGQADDLRHGGEDRSQEVAHASGS